MSAADAGPTVDLSGQAAMTGSSDSFVPVFILGVPRSGTTLLRVVLDSHSRVSGLPETPWLTGSYGPEISLRALLTMLSEHESGVVANVSGVLPDDVMAAGREFLAALFRSHLGRGNKNILIFKTPDDIQYLEFLAALYPKAKYIHIYRDGRDVALSQMAKKGSFFKSLGDFGAFNFRNVLRRWYVWENKVRRVVGEAGLDCLSLRYETLVASPEAELRRLCDFLGIPFEDEMLRYAEADHDYPSWEAGSTDVKAKGGIDTSSVYKWQKVKADAEMLYACREYEHFLVELGYPASNLRSGPWDRLALKAYPLTVAVSEAVRRLYIAVRWRKNALKRLF